MYIYLYVKQHQSTGLKYFGKTTRRDPFKYKGSGKHWAGHLRKHGQNIRTVDLWGFDDQDACTKFALEFSEKHHIVESNEWANLMPENGLDGGAIGKPHSEETKAKLRAAKLGKPHSEETKAKLRGKKLSEEHKAKIGAAGRRRIVSEETRTKLRGQKRSEETKARMRGKKLSEETKAKLRAAKLGKPLSEEHKAKIRVGTLGKNLGKNLGKKHSEETKAKMRKAAIRRNSANLCG
jgi:hypothetical protein